MEAGVPRIARVLRPHRGVVLAYHNIVPDGAPPCGDRSLHLPVGQFVRQLDLLARNYEIVPLDRLLTDAAPPRGRPRAAITFDDAYCGALTLGVPELERRGLPATVFVTPALLGRMSFWWDALAGPDGLDPRIRQMALEDCCGQEYAVRARAGELGLRAAPPPPRGSPATLEELTAAADWSGITLGSHTWDHANLTALAEPELERQLRLPLEWLRERFTTVIPWLSYPYGLYSRAVEARAAEAGYVAALGIRGGAWRATEPARHRLPRVNVPARVSNDLFLLRAAGLAGG